MKVSYLQIVPSTLGGLAILAALAFPVLRAISPRAPARVGIESEAELRVQPGFIRYQSTGAGEEALLFLHGFNSQLSIWDGVWPHLAGCGRFIRIDIPGFGGSGWPTNSYSLSEQAGRVIAFMDALGLSRVTLVGVSMGGSLSAWLASRYPDRIKGVVLLAPSGYPGSLHYGGLFGELLRPGLLNRLATGVAGSGTYRRLYPDSTALQALTVTASYGDAWARALAEIRGPAWVLWSRGDPGVPFSFADAVARAIPGGTLVPLAADAGHGLPATRPELIAKVACLAHRGASPGEALGELKQLLDSKGDG